MNDGIALSGVATPSLSAHPAWNGLLLWTDDPSFCNTPKTPVAATIYLRKILVPITTLFSNLLVNVQTAGNSYTNTQLGVYSSAGILLGYSDVLASAGTNTFGSTNAKTVPISTPFTVLGALTEFVWVACHMGTNSATAVALTGSSAGAGALNAGLSASTVRSGAYTGHATNSLATIGNLTPASIDASTTVGVPWMGVV